MGTPTKRDFLKILNDWFLEQKESYPSKLGFLSEFIFGFTLYDSEADKVFANNMLEVISAILEKKTFEYQEQGNEKYMNYLTMVNMPFLADKIEWGTSIRGAWFDSYAPNRGRAMHSIDGGNLEFSPSEIEGFMGAILDFAAE